MTRLARIVQDALDHLGWTADIVDDEASGQSHLATDAFIDDQPCGVFIDTDERLEAISVYIYPPFQVKPAYYSEACLLINAINVQARHGHLEILPKTGKVRLVFFAGIEGVSPTGLFVVRMLQFGDAILSRWMESLAAVAITGRPAEEVLAELANKEAAAEQAKAGGDRTAPAAASNTANPCTLH